jgi:hypothetical protein
MLSPGVSVGIKAAQKMAFLTEINCAYPLEWGHSPDLYERHEEERVGEASGAFNAEPDGISLRVGHAALRRTSEVICLGIPMGKA